MAGTGDDNCAPARDAVALRSALNPACRATNAVVEARVSAARSSEKHYFALG
jgi:hypothetical protein